MQTVNTNLFKNAYAFTLACKKMGNSRKGNINQVQVDADKTRLGLRKQLLASPELDAIGTHMRTVKDWCMKRCNPSYFKNGFFLVKKELVDEFNAQLQEGDRVLRQELLPAFQRAYPGQVDEARIALNGQFRDKDYPGVDELPARFGFDWNWVAFGVPEDLPAELRRAEEAKLTQKFKDAEQQILAALREGFQGLLDHALERLQTPPGERPKQFKESLITNITEFIETFSARNLLNDRELGKLVNQAKAVLTNVKPEDLDANKKEVSDSAAAMRQDLAQKFEPLKAAIDAMVEATPTRKFDFTEE